MILDNYELSTIHYTISYYIDNANLEEDENEWLTLLKEKVDSIMAVSYTHLTLPTTPYV